MPKDNFDDESGVPDKFIDPITLDVMRDPVVASNGITYDRSTFESLMKRYQGRDPINSSRQLNPIPYDNVLLRSEIIEYHRNRRLRKMRPTHVDICVADLYGRNLLFSKVPVQLSIGRFKKQYSKKSETPVEQMRLIYSGRQLEDQRTISSYSMSEKTQIHCLLRLGGD